jgi:hypothetical protein
VYQGQKISAPTNCVQRALVLSSLGSSWREIIAVSETIIPVMSEWLWPYFQNKARVWRGRSILSFARRA